MTASEDPESQYSSEAAGPAQPRDDLEHWLSDLRTEEAGWADADSGGELPPGRDPRPTDDREPDVPQPSAGGRHRAAD